eukprot:SAG22_NODE_2274_length_2765_cov_5.855214_4_plen_93_part_00
MTARSPSPVREAAAGVTYGLLGAYLETEKLRGDVRELQKKTATVDGDYLELVEADIKQLKKERREDKQRLSWLVVGSFLGGLLLGFILGQLR